MFQLIGQELTCNSRSTIARDRQWRSRQVHSSRLSLRSGRRSRVPSANGYTWSVNYGKNGIIGYRSLAGRTLHPSTKVQIHKVRCQVKTDPSDEPPGNITLNRHARSSSSLTIIPTIFHLPQKIFYFSPFTSMKFTFTHWHSIIFTQCTILRFMDK